MKWLVARIRSWPISEVSTRLVEVRKVGYSGLDLLMLCSSHFNPTATSAIKICCAAQMDRARIW